MKVIESVEEFDEAVKKDKVLVDFYADWCGPCKMIGPILEELEKEGLFELVKVNTDNFQDLSKEFGVMTIPNLKLFKDGKMIKEKSGIMSKEEVKDFIK